MSIQYQDIPGSARSHMELEVTLVGRTFTVTSGTFRIGTGVDYTLPEDNSFTLDVMPYRCALSAWLVQEKATGVVSVLVDDAPHGDGYRFERTDPYTNLHRLIAADIPADNADLTSVPILVFRRIRPEVPNG